MLLAGKVVTTASTNYLTSFSKATLFGPALEMGDLESVSTVHKCFPGTWEMLKSNLSIRNLNLRTLGGRLFSCFVLSNGMSGLWSVSTMKFIPIR